MPISFAYQALKEPRRAGLLANQVTYSAWSTKNVVHMRKLSPNEKNVEVTTRGVDVNKRIATKHPSS